MSVKLVGVVAVPDEKVRENEEHARSLGLPKVYFPPFHHNEKLAVVGGGPSIRTQWDEIRKFKHILAINNTRNTLKQYGIDATFFTIDPTDIVTEWARGATNALVATRCDPSVFEALKGSNVRVFDTPGDVPMLTSSASTAVPLAMKMGFRQVCFFGCESSYKGTSHVDRHEDREVIKVRADGKDFITAGDYFFIAQELSNAIRANPGVITEKSGGLLRAMVRDPNAAPIAIGRLGCIGT